MTSKDLSEKISYNPPPIKRARALDNLTRGDIKTEYLDLEKLAESSIDKPLDTDDLLAGVTDQDLNSNDLTGFGQQYSDLEVGYERQSSNFRQQNTIKSSGKGMEEVIADVQNFGIIKKAINSILKDPDIKSELPADWFDNEDMVALVTEAVVEKYGELEIDEDDVKKVIDNVYK